jgi:HEAT repeat protein
MQKLCSHADPHVRRGALLAGGLGPDARATMLERLADAEAPVRAAACHALGALADPTTIPAILRHFGGSDSEEHHAAAEALGRMPPESLHVLEPHLDLARGEANVLAALRVLEAARYCSGPCLALTRAESPAVRRAALRTMAADPTNPPSASIAMLDDADEAVRIEAVEVLVRAGCREAIPRLLACLDQEDLLRYHVIRGLGRLHATEAAAPLLALFDRALTHERIEIVNALIRIAPPGIIAFLRARLEEPEVAIRRVAADGVARLGGAPEVPLLNDLAGDPDWNVRNHVAWGLGRIGDPAGRTTLLELVRDVEPVVARTARTALTKISN